MHELSPRPTGRLPPEELWPALTAGANALWWLTPGKTWREVAKDDRRGLSAAQTRALAGFAESCFPCMKPYFPEEHAVFEAEFDRAFPGVAQRLPTRKPARAILAQTDERFAVHQCVCFAYGGAGMEGALFSDVYVGAAEGNVQPTDEVSVTMSLLNGFVRFRERFESQPVVDAATSPLVGTDPDVCTSASTCS